MAAGYIDVDGDELCSASDVLAVINHVNARGVGQEEIPVAIIGAGNDVLIGGNDRLSGGQGRDLLIRGIGKDSLQAGQEEDVLIGGDFAYSRDAGALDSIMAIWGSKSPRLSGSINYARPA